MGQYHPTKLTLDQRTLDRLDGTAKRYGLSRSAAARLLVARSTEPKEVPCLG